jgi:sugar (pentulose or hexulose) kinase
VQCPGMTHGLTRATVRSWRDFRPSWGRGFALTAGRSRRFTSVSCYDSRCCWTCGWTIAAPYVASRLCDAGMDGCYIDVGSISYSGHIDLISLQWDEELCHAVGLPVGMNPKVLKPTDQVGRLGGSAAREIGVPEGCPVFAGIGDFPAAVLGGGILDQGQLGEVLGTASMIFGTSGDSVLPLDWGLRASRSAIEGVWIVFALIPGGDLVAWARKTLADSAHVWLDDRADHQSLQALWSQLQDAFFVPLSDDRGTWVGMRADVSAAELMGTVLEAQAFEHEFARQRILRAVNGSGQDIPIRIVGGSGAKNPRWMELKAAVADREVLVREGIDPTLFGSAIIGGVAVGWNSDVASMAAAFESKSLAGTYHSVRCEIGETEVAKDRLRRYVQMKAAACKWSSACNGDHVDAGCQESP